MSSRSSIQKTFLRTCINEQRPRLRLRLKTRSLIVHAELARMTATWSYQVCGTLLSLQCGLLTIDACGNSILRQGVSLLSPKCGVNMQDQGDGWSHSVGTVSPGIPGDSGSGFMDKVGNAFGVLSTLQFAPLPASNGVGDLAKELAYSRTFRDFAGVQLATGTAPFAVALPDLSTGLV